MAIYIYFSLQLPSGPIQYVSRIVYDLCVSVSVCALSETPLPGGLETYGQRALVTGDM